MIPIPSMVPTSPTRRGAALSYRHRDSRRTLREGLEEYRRSMPGLLDEDGLDERARELFHNHDIAHIVFGCDISVRQEAMVDTWTLFGTDVGFSTYLDYLKVPEAQNILREAGLLHMAWESLKSVPSAWRVYRNARRMQKPWPFFDHDAYLDRPLAQIRAEFGIELVA